MHIVILRVTLLVLNISKMTEETTVKGFRLKNSTLDELNKIANKERRKLNNLVSIVLDDYALKHKIKGNK